MTPRALTVVSWNVLAGAYVRPDYYPHSPVEVLDPAARSARVIDRGDRDVTRTVAVDELTKLSPAERPADEDRAAVGPPLLAHEAPLVVA